MISQPFNLQLKKSISNFSNRWSTEKRIDNDINHGKEIIRIASKELLNIISSRPPGFSESIERDLVPIIRQMRELEDHQLFLDGGASLKDFWDQGDEVIISLKKIIPTGT